MNYYRKLKLHIIFFVLVTSIAVSTHCAQEDALKDTGAPAIIPPVPTYVKIINQSQWDLEHLFLYPWSKITEKNESLLSENIKPSGFREYCVNSDDYYVSVTRKKNQDGPLLSFSLATPLEMKIKAQMELEFLENEFRLERKDAGLNRAEWNEYVSGLETLAINEEGEVIIPEHIVDKKKIDNCITYDNDIVMQNLEQEPCVCPWDGPSGELYFLGTYACSLDDGVDTALTLYAFDDDTREFIRLTANDNISGSNAYSKMSYYLEPGTYYVKSENTKYEGKGCYYFMASKSALPLAGSSTKEDDTDDVFTISYLLENLLNDLDALVEIPLETESIHYDNDAEGGDDWFKIVIPKQDL